MAIYHFDIYSPLTRVHKAIKTGFHAILKKTPSIVSLSLTVILACAAFTSQAQLENIPLVSVRGEAVVKVLPDHAIITVNVPKQVFKANLHPASYPTLFQTENNQIRMAGVNDIDIVYPIEQIFSTDSMLFIQKDYILSVKDINKLGRVVFELLRRGFRNFEISYRSTAIQEHKREARNLAIENARQKAVAYIKGTGQALGSIHSITELEIPPINYYTSKEIYSEQELKGESYIYNPGHISIPCFVDVSFDLIK
ncbi:SIMPL domain-containing protein [Cytophagaceae bacterium ABcell3]|nr:SIMPL domain-containing protein [Cytophagaceae bacterium ABcell3]